MADKITVARPYARAAFAEAQAHKVLGPWSNSLQRAAAVVKDPRVQNLLGNPSVTTAELAKLVIDLAERAVELPDGFHLLVTFWRTPGWANGGAGETTLPTHPGDYANAIKWAAARYAGKVDAWEVWNEPNEPYAMTGTDPVQYAAHASDAHRSVAATVAHQPPAASAAGKFPHPFRS